MSMEYIGVAPALGKAVFLVPSGTIEELPGKIRLPCPRFVLLLIYDASARAERLWDVLNQLLEQGCVYLCNQSL